jgi:hypothetical protein
MHASGSIANQGVPFGTGLQDAISGDVMDYAPTSQVGNRTLASKSNGDNGAETSTGDGNLEDGEEPWKVKKAREEARDARERLVDGHWNTSELFFCAWIVPLTT